MIFAPWSYQVQESTINGHCVKWFLQFIVHRPLDDTCSSKLYVSRMRFSMLPLAGCIEHTCSSIHMSTSMLQQHVGYVHVQSGRLTETYIHIAVELKT